MSRLIWSWSITLCFAFAAESSAQNTNLPTGKTIADQVAPGLPLNSFPAVIAISPDQTYAAILNNGYGTNESKSSQSIAVLNLNSGKVMDFPESRLSRKARQTYFYGLAFSGDGKKLYASMGSESDPSAEKQGSTGNGIAVYDFKQGQVTPADFIAIPSVQLPMGRIAAAINKAQRPGELIPYPAGIAVFSDGGMEKILVAGNLSDTVFLLDAATKKVVHEFDLSTHKVIPASYPLSVIVTKDGSTAYVSLWNASRVAELDIRKGKVRRLIPVSLSANRSQAGSHPCAMLFSPDEKSLYIALANRDEVAVINRASGSVRQSFRTTPPTVRFNGAFPIALGVTADYLFVANSAMNSIAVFQTKDLGNAKLKPRPISFIPTEWFPSAIAVQGDELLIANAKGRGTGSNGAWLPPTSTTARRKHPYIFSLLAGSLTQVKISNFVAEMSATGSNAIDQAMPSAKLPFQGGRNPIKHVIYVVKENRTYDQVFGDIQEGNGDPSLLLYGEDITPNQHKLAREFGILDNFYVSGEVSGDGHNWTMSATGSDYLEKTIQITYRGAERTYDYEGEVANRFPLKDAMPDINEPSSGYIFTLAAKHGLRYRHYGEFITTQWCEQMRSDSPPTEGTPGPTGSHCARASISKGEALPDYLGGGQSPWPWKIPMIAENVPTKPELRGHFDPWYPDFEQGFPDQLRADKFLQEFATFVEARKTGRGDELPNYILLRLPNDHTSGTKAGTATPSAAVADNDLALGRVVEAVSHSPYWDDTAILVLEDDAQDGADHVDAHRSPALVISKYSPGTIVKPHVDSTFFTTVSMVRTLEVLLGLPPMNVNDAYAPVITSVFSGPGTKSPFVADDRNLKNGLLYEVNPKNAPGGRESAAMDFSHADAADAEVLNRILWIDRRPNDPLPKIHSHFGVVKDKD